jgi:biopolymer transport protein ExbB/TolQ
MALLLQGPENAAPANTGTALLEILANSSTISKAVLLILAAFSIASWGITFYKLWMFRRLVRQSATFIDVPPQQQVLQAVCGSPESRRRPVPAGYAELTAQERKHRQRNPRPEPIHAAPRRVLLSRASLRSIAR